MTFKEAEAIKGYIMTIVNPSNSKEYCVSIEEKMTSQEDVFALNVSVGSLIFESDWNIIAGVSAIFGVTYCFNVYDQYFYLY